MRLLYELSTSDAASFLTLTYNNDNLPSDNGLHKEDLQKFFKRLRMNMQRKYHEFAPKLRYYACGEYGDTQLIYLSPGAEKCHGRPHYHAIVFGLDDLNDEHREIVKKSWNKCEDYLFDKDRGRKSGMQEVSPDDINYVCGYVQKKLNGQYGKELYGNSQAPFSISSQGLGLEFALKNKERLLNNGWTVFKGHKVSVPRYFCEKFDVKKSELLDIQNNSNMEMETKELLELFKQDMIAKHTWYPDNVTMMTHRFELWYDRKEYETARIIYNDFLQRRKLRGKGL